jgi:hypothetical protein
MGGHGRAMRIELGVVGRRRFAPSTMSEGLHRYVGKDTGKVYLTRYLGTIKRRR